MFAGDWSLRVKKPAYSRLYRYCHWGCGPLEKLVQVGDASTDVEYVSVDVMVVVVVAVTVDVTLSRMVIVLVWVEVDVKDEVIVVVVLLWMVFRGAVTVAWGTPLQAHALIYLLCVPQLRGIGRPRLLKSSDSSGSGRAAKGKWPRGLAARLSTEPVSAATATESGKCPRAPRAARSESAVGRGSGILLRAPPCPAQGWIVLVVETVVVGFSVTVLVLVSVNERVLVEVSKAHNPS